MTLNVMFSDTEKSVNSPRSTGNAFKAFRAACVNASVVAALSAIDFSDCLVESVEECRGVARGEHERWTDLDDVVEHTGVARQKAFVFESIAELDCSARIRRFAPTVFDYLDGEEQALAPNVANEGATRLALKQRLAQGGPDYARILAQVVLFNDINHGDPHRRLQRGRREGVEVAGLGTEPLDQGLARGGGRQRQSIPHWLSSYHDIGRKFRDFIAPPTPRPAIAGLDLVCNDQAAGCADQCRGAAHETARNIWQA